MALKIAITGGMGRTGSACVEALHLDPECIIAGVGVRDASTLDQTAYHYLISDDLETLISTADVVIDFTLPEYALHVAQLCALKKTPLVVGTTGFTSPQITELLAHQSVIPLLWSTNMSFGANVLFALVEQAARILDTSFDIEILDIHHRLKKDAPSGTAITLAEKASSGRGLPHPKLVLERMQRETVKHDDEIGIASLRAGGVPGKHSVYFTSQDEQIELSYQAFNRLVYGKGAVKAAKWLVKQPSGHYSMYDVLGIKEVF